jgi:hypothetical protein
MQGLFLWFTWDIMGVLEIYWALDAGKNMII